MYWNKPIPGSIPKLLILNAPELAYDLCGMFVIFLNIYTALQHLSKADSGQKYPGLTLFRALSQKLHALFEHRCSFSPTYMADRVSNLTPKVTTAESAHKKYWENPIPGSDLKSSGPIERNVAYLHGFV